MKSLSQNDFMALLSALETINGIGSLNGYSSGVFSAVKKVLSCNTICYNEVALPDSLITWLTEPADAIPDPYLKEAFMRHFSEHPVLVHYIQTGEGRSYRISDFLSQRQFHALALYNEYYKKSDVEYQLISSLLLGHDQMIGIALDRDCLDFSEDECLKLDLLRPHLLQSYRNVQALDLMRRAAEESGTRLLVVSRSGRVRLASDDAWCIISRYFQLPRCPGSLPGMLGRWVNSERARFNDGSAIPSPSVPLVVRNETSKLLVRFLWGGKIADQDLLLIEEQMVIPDAMPTVGGKLTHRETEVLTWLSQGKTNAEIGLALSISPRTVKKHLENIYDKLQVRRRGEAVDRFHRL